MGEQIETVLDLSQSEAGLLPLAEEQIELMPFVTRIVEERVQRINEAGLDRSVMSRMSSTNRKLSPCSGALTPTCRG